MKTPLLLLLSLTRLSSAHSRASVKVDPDRTQFFEYEHIEVTCEHLDSDQWTVWRYTRDSLRLSECGSGWGTQTRSSCSINTVKLTTSGVYWCQSRSSESSSAINVTVTDRPLILESPVRPVMQGSDVTLRCQTKDTPTGPMVFFKDDRRVGVGPAGHVTLHNVSKADEGAYKCQRDQDRASPTSWLIIKADDSDESLSLASLPESTQLSEYENLSLTCSSSSDDTSGSFRVKRFTTSTGTLSTCGVQWGTLTSSGCQVMTLKPPDSAIYWCESLTLQRSSSVNITVYAGSDKTVLLRGPVHPPAEGDNVTLRCETTAAPFNRPASFYKDDFLVQATPTGHMTLYHISKSSEGVYRCDVSGAKSPPLWLLVKGDPVASAASHVIMFPMIRCVVVSLPYVMSTLFMVIRYRDITQSRLRHAEKSQSVPMTPEPEPEPDAEYDEISDADHEATVANVTTEHRF